MSLVLHRFPLSHFCEKGRALLDFKGLDYEIRDYMLGLPQRKLVKLSGQRKVPVIEHDGRVVYDTTRIANYLDEILPDFRPLVSKDPLRRQDALALENRIDRVLGVGAPVVWAEYALEHPDHLDLLALEVHGVGVRGVRAMGAVARTARHLGICETFVSKWTQRTRALLRDLVTRLERAPYLCGTDPGLADVAAAGLAFHLEFPQSRYLAVPEFAGRGVTPWTNDPELRPFFLWRRKFYRTYLK